MAATTAPRGINNNCVAIAVALHVLVIGLLSIQWTAGDRRFDNPPMEVDLIAETAATSTAPVISETPPAARLGVVELPGVALQVLRHFIERADECRQFIHGPHLHPVREVSFTSLPRRLEQRGDRRDNLPRQNQRDPRGDKQNEQCDGCQKQQVEIANGPLVGGQLFVFPDILVD